jgi:alkaline phosphatase
VPENSSKIQNKIEEKIGKRTKMYVTYREILLMIFTIKFCRNAPLESDDRDKYYWYDKNAKLLHSRMGNIPPEYQPRVKNVIIFIGDGMGTETITASRTLKRQISSNYNAQLVFDEFPATAFMKTDIANSQIAESAASSTALFCGAKTNFENLGVDITAGRDACTRSYANTPSVIAWAQEEKLKTGLVIFRNLFFTYYSRVMNYDLVSINFKVIN